MATDDDDGKDVEISVHGRTYIVIAVPGATFWRFWIDAKEDGVPADDRKWDPIVITPHVYDSADDALDAGVAWLNHPYRLPDYDAQMHDRARSKYKATWRGP